MAVLNTGEITSDELGHIGTGQYAPGFTAPATPGVDISYRPTVPNARDPNVRGSGPNADTRGYTDMAGITRNAQGNAVDQNESINQIRERLDNQRNELLSAVRSAGASRAQAAADEAQKLGQGEEARVAATNLSSGLIGSNVAVSNSNTAAALTSKRVAAARSPIEAATEAEIQQVLSNADAREEAQITAAKNLALTTAKDQRDFADKQKAGAEADLATIAGQPNAPTLQELQKSSYYQKLLTQAGGNQLVFDAKYNATLDAAKKVTYTYHSLGNGTVLRTGVTANGTAVPETKLQYDIPEGFQLTTAPDGTALLWNKNTGEAKVAPGTTEGQFAKPIEPKTATPLTPEEAALKKAQTDEIRAKIASGSLGSGNMGGKEILGYDVEDILTGRNSTFNLRQSMGRSNETKKYMENLRLAIKQKDPTFDFAASDAGTKFVSSTYYQKSMAAINAVIPDVKIATDLSDQVARLGIKGVDALLQKGGIQIGNQKVSNLKQAQLLLADTIGIALGQGTVSDMKLQLGFDLTDPSVQPDVFFSNMQTVVKFVENRKGGLEDQRYKSSTVGGNTGTKDPSTMTNEELDAYIKANGG